MRKLRLMVAALATLALLGAACGDDGGDVDAGGPTPGVGTGTDADADADAGDDGDDGDDGGDGPGGGGLAGLLSDDCRFLLAGAYLNPLAALGGGGAGGEFDGVSGYLDEIASRAPSEISSDMAVIARAFERFAEVFRDVDLSDPQSFTDPEVQAAYAEVAEVFDDEYEAAADAVGDWIDENCSP